MAEIITVPKVDKSHQDPRSVGPDTEAAHWQKVDEDETTMTIEILD